MPVKSLGRKPTAPNIQSSEKAPDPKKDAVGSKAAPSTRETESSPVQTRKDTLKRLQHDRPGPTPIAKRLKKVLSPRGPKTTLADIESDPQVQRLRADAEGKTTQAARLTEEIKQIEAEIDRLNDEEVDLAKDEETAFREAQEVRRENEAERKRLPSLFPKASSETAEAEPDEAELISLIRQKETEIAKRLAEEGWGPKTSENPPWILMKSSEHRELEGLKKALRAIPNRKAIKEAGSEKANSQKEKLTRATKKLEGIQNQRKEIKEKIKTKNSEKTKKESQRDALNKQANSAATSANDLVGYKAAAAMSAHEQSIARNKQRAEVANNKMKQERQHLDDLRRAAGNPSTAEGNPIDATDGTVKKPAAAEENGSQETTDASRKSAVDKTHINNALARTWTDQNIADLVAAHTDLATSLTIENITIGDQTYSITVEGNEDRTTEQLNALVRALFMKPDKAFISSLESFINGTGQDKVELRTGNFKNMPVILTFSRPEAEETTKVDGGRS